MIAICRSLSIYLLGKPEVEAREGARAEARVKAQKALSIEIRILLPLIETHKIFLISLFLLIKEKLQQVRSLAI